MQYMLLLHGDESQDADLSPEDLEAMMAEYGAYEGALDEAGVMRGGEALLPSHTATTLRDHEGNIQVMDGPFLETREQLGGFYLIEVDTLDDALAWAKRCPALKGGAIEVRPVMEMPDGA